MAILLQFFALLGSSNAHADFLEDCRALTLEEDQIHNCLDNFLDLMDDNMSDLVAFVSAEFAGAGPDDNAALTAFQNSQAAFEQYRRENCLWYLAFSTPRAEAEQIAKNCLANMSQQRLSELQRLLNEDDGVGDIEGYYVYGANRNTFQPCGDASRYWVEGDNVVVSQLQQDYLSKSTAELQILYVSLGGKIDSQAGATFPEHDGVFQLLEVRSVRIPTDKDCQLPSKSVVSESSVPAPEPVAEVPVASTQELVGQTQQTEPEQSLIAYFGEWIAKCEQVGKNFGCVLSVPLSEVAGSGGTETSADSSSGAGAGDASADRGLPLVRITRRSGARTVVDLELPDSPGMAQVQDVDQISWAVDNVEMGTILHSRLESVEGGKSGLSYTRQAFRERWFIRDELLPLLQRGAVLKLDVAPASSEVRKLQASLKGLSRALAFADDFSLAELDP